MKQSNKPKYIFILQAIVVAIGISIFSYSFIATPSQISGDSMLPYLSNGDLVLTNKISPILTQTPLKQLVNYQYQRGEIIVFRKDGKEYIKRIIAIPGDSVSLEDGYVSINDKIVEEKYLQPGTRTLGADYIQEGDKRTIRENEYFVLGDNRTDSEDSRFSEIKLVNSEEIIGKVFFRYWPLNKIGIISKGNIEYRE